MNPWIVAGLLFSAPSAAVLCLLALLGRLDWAAALAAAAGVAAVIFGLLRPHFRHLAAVHDYLEALRSPARGRAPPAPPAGRPSILAPDLDAALVETAQERDRQRRALETAIAGTEAILANLPDPLILLDGDRRILRANAAAEALLGAELVGRDLVGVLRDPGVLDAVDAAIAGRGSEVHDFVLPGKIERHLSARSAALDHPTIDGSVAILALHDLTALHRAEQLRADFVANASHELRTPLASLVGFIETLRGPAREDPEAHEQFLAIMQDQAGRMTRLVEDLLSLSRIEMQEHNPPSGTVALAPLLASVAAGLEPRASAKDMRFAIAPAGDVSVVGERDELAQVFQNLLDNAVKYGRAGSEVRVVTTLATPEEDDLARRLDRACARVAVIDQGEGIAREQLSRITERFYRVDAARSRALGGTGLGLAIVKHIVNRHRGLLNIDSEPGRGSSFTVYLPLAETPKRAS